jgi:hypothetical protein
LQALAKRARQAKRLAYNHRMPKNAIFCDSGPAVIHLLEKNPLIFYFGGLDFTQVDSLQRLSSKRNA